MVLVMNYTKSRLYFRQVVLSIKKIEAFDFSRMRVQLYIIIEDEVEKNNNWEGNTYEK